MLFSDHTSELTILYIIRIWKYNMEMIVHRKSGQVCTHYVNLFLGRDRSFFAVFFKLLWHNTYYFFNSDSFGQNSVEPRGSIYCTVDSFTE